MSEHLFEMLGVPIVIYNVKLNCTVKKKCVQSPVLIKHHERPNIKTQRDRHGE